MSVSNRLMSVLDRFMSAFDRLITFFCGFGRFLPLIFIIRMLVERLKQVTNDRNAQKRSLNDRKRSGTMNGQ